ncbi:hypothetical protein CXB51_020150 [Gossypium anomalum]|uniref:RHOMBOID-like protein n=1 Tax=Gossypium anomalum TaxID=47600 RepID=A0A8J5YJ88_9ROSI|nr:hypothetical protein CXB51_020150 [Gossypium anomalum]
MYINDCPNNNLGFEGSHVAKFLGKLSFQPLKENPLFGPSFHSTKLGQDSTWQARMEAHHLHLATCWRYSSCLINDHLIHYLLNEEFDHLVVIAYICVFPLTVRIGLIYLLSGFGGSILSSLFIQDNISVGASGALFGLLGAILSTQIRYVICPLYIYALKAKMFICCILLENSNCFDVCCIIVNCEFVDLCVYVAALITLMVIIAINLVVGILPQVNNFAHISGFLTGFLLGFVLLLRPQFGWVQRQHVPASAPGIAVCFLGDCSGLGHSWVTFVLMLTGKIDMLFNLWMGCRFTVRLVMLFREKMKMTIAAGAIT